MLKIALIGAGHLGKIHLRCIQSVPTLELVGFFDMDKINADKIVREFSTISFDNLDELIDAVDIVDIVTPTIYHYKVAEATIKKGKHVFIEKPLTHTIQEAKKLIALAEKHNVKVQVGHVERFNPAFLAIKNIALQPMFIEAHRLASFNPRGTDVSVILDLMIHDIDLILHVVKSDVKKIHASGVSVVSATPDIANVRLEFENGCVANLTASRISMKQMRKVRMFQEDAYISLDFLEKSAQLIRLHDEKVLKQFTATERDAFMPFDSARGKRWLEIKNPDVPAVNAIALELSSFAEAIENNTPSLVSIYDGYAALNIAHKIIKKIGDSKFS